MISDADAESIEEILRDCEEARRASNHPFTKWELDFIDSIGESFEEHGRLTVKQRERLIEVWRKI